METNTLALPAETDSAGFIHKHAARLVAQGLLRQDGAAEVARALERALSEARAARIAVIGFIDAVLYAHRERLCPTLIHPRNAEGSQLLVQHAPLLDELIRRALLPPAYRPLLRTVLPQVEAWFPAAGITGYLQHHFFSTGDRRRGLVLDVARATAVLKMKVNSDSR